PVPSCRACGTVWPSPLSTAWTPSWAGLVTTRVRSGSSARAAAIAQSNIGRPATGCRTLGILEFIRTPRPAASTTTVTLPRGSDEMGRLDPADALARMGGIGGDYTAPTLPSPARGGGKCPDEEGLSFRPGLGIFAEQASHGLAVEMKDHEQS